MKPYNHFRCFRFRPLPRVSIRFQRGRSLAGEEGRGEENVFLITFCFGIKFDRARLELDFPRLVCCIAGCVAWRISLSLSHSLYCTFCIHASLRAEGNWDQLAGRSISWWLWWYWWWPPYSCFSPLAVGCAAAARAASRRLACVCERERAIDINCLCFVWRLLNIPYTWYHITSLPISMKVKTSAGPDRSNGSLTM